MPVKNDFGIQEAQNSFIRILFIREYYESGFWFIGH